MSTSQRYTLRVIRTGQVLGAGLTYADLMAKVAVVVRDDPSARLEVSVSRLTSVPPPLNDDHEAGDPPEAA